MRIIVKECRKVLDLRVLAVIAVFTLLYYQVFMEYAYSVNGVWMKYVFSISEELMSEVGTTLSREDLPILSRKRAELVERADIQIAGNEVFAELGVKSYDEMEEVREEIKAKWGSNEGLTWQEQRIESEITAILNLRDDETTKYLRQIEYLDDLREICLYEERFGVPGEDAEHIVGKYWSGTSPLYQRAEAAFCQREMSLIPHGVYLDVLWPDMMDMVRLLVICCFFLIVPYQVHERLRGVMPLYASTHTGRRIFGKQFCASIFACGIMCLVQLLIYLGVFVSRRLWVFWKCSAWSNSVNEFWFPFSFGLYMAVYMFMVWLFAMGSAALAYCMGRWASNYVTGIALSIPVGGIACLLGMRLFHNLFCFYLFVRVPMWEVPALAAWLAAAAGLIIFVLKKDRRRGL